jgi:K+-transporting ATPase ATPase C chain
MKIFLKPFMLFLNFTVLCGIIYPAVVTIFSRVFFFEKSHGSLITRDGALIGSTLISQNFNRSEYFFSRPSSCDYNADPSAPSNFGPTNKILAQSIKQRREHLRLLHNNDNVPEDLLTTSGSGLDPHISKAAANFQAERIANARNIIEDDVLSLIAAHLEGEKFALFGESRVNVLMLNLSLDRLYGKP